MRLELPKSGSREVLEYIAGLPEIGAGEEVELDFGRVSVLTSFYMLVLGTALRRELAGKGRQLRFTGFQREAVENYAGYMGMKHLLDETLPVEGLKEAGQDEGTHLPISIPTGRELDTQDLLRRLSEAGEREASTIRNAFKQASKPSRGLLTELGIHTPPQG